MKLADGQTVVEITQYLPDAEPGSAGSFASRSDQPRNPMVDLRIHRPGDASPMRQIALARFPSLNLDRMHGQTSRVQFWYHHPAVKPNPGVEFLQTPDGKLFARIQRDGKLDARGEVRPGEQLALDAQITLTLAEHLPAARREISFRSVPSKPGDESSLPAAVLVRATVADAQRNLWLRQNDPEHGAQQLATPDGPVVVEFDEEQLSLGFALKLLDFRRGMNPGRMGAASFASKVQLIDENAGVEREYEVSMNAPLTHGKYTFYQSSYQELPDGREASILTVAYDPGGFLKYLGSALICLGTIAMFARRQFVARGAVAADSQGVSE